MDMDFTTFKEQLLNQPPETAQTAFSGRFNEIDGESAASVKNVFFFLALMFRYPTEDVYTEIQRHMDAFSSFFMEYTGRVPKIPEIEDLQSEYVALFVNNRGFVPAIPYASCHIDEGLLMGDSLFSLRQIMQKTGFMLDGSVKELEDHLSVLLEFCAGLVDTLLQRQKAGDPVEYENISALLETTYRYIGPILKDFTDGIDGYASHDFYRAAGEALNRLIEDSDMIYAQLLGFGN